LRKPQSAVT